MKVARNGFLTFGEEDGIYSSLPLSSRRGRAFSLWQCPRQQKNHRVRSGSWSTLTQMLSCTDQPGHYDGERLFGAHAECTDWRGYQLERQTFRHQMRTGEWWIDSTYSPE